jgi:hypothetical protein
MLSLHGQQPCEGAIVRHTRHMALEQHFRQTTTLVAQIFNLLYRRFVIGLLSACLTRSRTADAWDLQERVGHSRGTQVKNLRYGRLKICATPAARRPSEPFLACCRCQQGAYDLQQATFPVAQIFNLLYRRFVIGLPSACLTRSHTSDAQGLQGRVGHSRGTQVKNLRYSRLKICATPAASRTPFHTLFALRTSHLSLRFASRIIHSSFFGRASAPYTPGTPRR